MHSLMPKLGDIDQGKDAFFLGIAAEEANDSAVFGSGDRNDLMKIQMGSRTSQLHLSPQVNRKRKEYLSRHPADHDMIAVNDRSPHHENEAYSRVPEPMNNSPFAPMSQ